VFDIDGTREAARQRALPQTDELPPALRRLDDVCAAFLPRQQTQGKTTACSTIRWPRRVCTSPLINYSSGLQSQMVRSLYDCPQVPVGPAGVLCRVVVATHPATKKKSPVGVTRAGVVYELFFTNLPQRAFTACDVVELYLHRGAFEPLLSDPRPGDRSRPVV